jgi:hypothetical protein
MEATAFRVAKKCRDSQVRVLCWHRPLIGADVWSQRRAWRIAACFLSAGRLADCQSAIQQFTKLRYLRGAAPSEVTSVARHEDDFFMCDPPNV